MATIDTLKKVLGMFTRIFEHPEDSSTIAKYSDWQAYVDFNWSYYIGSMFDRTELSSGSIDDYINKYDLYNNTKLLVNPARQLVNFYVDSVYPGILSYDGQNLTNGQINAIPFSYKVDTKLKSAIGQLWLWSNFQAQKSIIVRQGAAIGSAFVEIIDDISRGQIVSNVVWPGFVKDLKLDTMGNVKAYTIEYKDVDEEGTPYTYTKMVDNKTLAYFKDGKPFDYFDNGSSIYEHNYGFCPAVWIKHQDIGSKQGLPCIAGSIGKIDEICALLSHIIDLDHKLIESPMIFWAEGQITGDLGNENKVQGQANDDFSSLGKPNKKGTNKKSLILKGPPNGKVETLAPVVNVDSILKTIEVLQTEIAKDHPEVTYYDDLRAMSQVTGVAVDRLIGDVVTKVAEVSANYDRQLIKLFQMCVAIAGQHANDGTWVKPLNAQQEKFLPFDLTSYDKDELNIDIEPRPLIRQSVAEKSAERVAYWGGVQAAVDGGDVLELVLEDDGLPEDRIAAIMKKKEENKAVAAAIQGGQNQNNNLPSNSEGDTSGNTIPPATTQSLNTQNNSN